MRHFITLIFLLIIFISCDTNSNQQEIRVCINSDTTIVLNKKNANGNIYRIDYRIKGNFNEKITVTEVNLNSFSYKYELKGNVDSIFGGDWYSDTLLLRFENIKTPIIDLEIEYTFYDF